MNTKSTITCKRCNQPGGEILSVGLHSMAVPCDKCTVEIREEAKAIEAEERRVQRERYWRRICPAIYRDTDCSHEGLDPRFVSAADSFIPGRDKGLGFVGKTGTGKTRLLYRCLHKAHSCGWTVYAISHVDFAKAALSVFSDDPRTRNMANDLFRTMRAVKYLLIDDLGKARSNESANEAIEDMIEYRVSNDKPTLWSTNAGGKWLEGRFGPDRGGAITRRLTEFSDVIKS